MAEFQIAKSMAEVLYKLQHSSNYDHDDDDECDYDQYRRRRRRVSTKLSSEELDLARLTGMTAELAMSRAREANRDFKTVMAETEFRVSIELARILASTIDPVLQGLRKVKVEEEGEVCGVCQDDMEVGDDEARAMGCMHKFHGHCIFKWLKHKNVCPLCRHPNM
ncbi:unnamed protein product [Camellia sinensis]